MTVEQSSLKINCPNCFGVFLVFKFCLNLSSSLLKITMYLQIFTCCLFLTQSKFLENTFCPPAKIAWSYAKGRLVVVFIEHK